MTSPFSRNQLASAPVDPNRKPNLLVVEDEESYRTALRLSLEREGFSVTTAVDGREALVQFRSSSPDLILLDVMLPHVSGVDVCREIRKVSNVPIIFLSARSAEIDVVIGLELGADDYVAKPFRMRELVARIRTTLRRGSDRVAEPVDEVEVYEHGRLRLDLVKHEISLGDVPLALPRKEFQVLALLLRNAGRAMSRTTLITQVWGADYVGDTKTLDVHIKRIRRKLEAEGESNRCIVTVRGFGYKFEPDTKAGPSSISA
jgi:two-component system, OmpR family, response regulator RegX3